MYIIAYLSAKIHIFEKMADRKPFLSAKNAFFAILADKYGGRGL